MNTATANHCHSAWEGICTALREAKVAAGKGSPEKGPLTAHSAGKRRTRARRLTNEPLPGKPPRRRSYEEPLLRCNIYFVSVLLPFPSCMMHCSIHEQDRSVHVDRARYISAEAPGGPWEMIATGSPVLPERRRHGRRGGGAVIQERDFQRSNSFGCHVEIIV
jgi:hypothetical protein